MNRRALLMAVAGMAGCSRTRSARLNVFNWSDYVAPETVPDFEREFGVAVRYATYESDEEMLAKVFSGNSGWDVVFPSNSFVGPMRDLRLLAPLRHDLLPNLHNLDTRFQAPPWDPQLEWCVPYMHGSTGIVYQKHFDIQPQAWQDLWSSRYRGRLTMLDDPAEVLGACLKKLGYSINSTDPRELDQAKREAIRQKPLVRAYLNAEVRDQLVAGDVLVAQLWATSAQQAIDVAPGLAFVYPAEGFPLYADTAVILRESRRRDLAHRFIDYLLRPKVAARIASYTKTATANGAAQRLLAPAMRDNPTLYPPAAVLARGEWFRPLSAAAHRLRDRLWTEIKAS
ncbi:MAG TPA: spermidine/putrescine ABC transporter substrate-binding protein [Bryobacteraceae bacterium]|nr:spermidine/putrescine ABC transporter substrate-binding protein [Bryobacteraceae bacterium]